MAELLTRAIVEEYWKRAKALPDTAGGHKGAKRIKN